MQKQRKRSMVLEQKADYGSAETVFFYVVVSLKNTTEPRVHSSLKAKEVEKLIKEGYEVTIK